MVTGHRPLPTPKLPHHGGAGQTPTCTLGPLPTDGRPRSLLPRSVAPSQIHDNPHQAQPTPPPLGCVTAQRLQCTGRGGGKGPPAQMWSSTNPGERRRMDAPTAGPSATVKVSRRDSGDSSSFPTHIRLPREGRTPATALHRGLRARAQPYFCILLQASCKAGGTQEGAGISPGPASYTPGSRPEEESAVCPGPRGQQAWE